jgi:hypothetical protein
MTQLRHCIVTKVALGLSLYKENIKKFIINFELNYQKQHAFSLTKKIIT